MNYQLKLNSKGEEDQAVYRIADDGTKSIVPFIEENKDYQEYLKWLDDGNEPEEAE